MSGVRMQVHRWIRTLLTGIHLSLYFQVIIGSTVTHTLHRAVFIVNNFVQVRVLFDLLKVTISICLSMNHLFHPNVRSGPDLESWRWPQHQNSTVKRERHLVEHVPPPGWTVYVLYPNDRPDLNQNLNQNRIYLFFLPTKLINQVLS